MSDKIFLLNSDVQKKLIDEICFKKCCKIQVGAIEITTGFGLSALFLPCLEEECKYQDSVRDINLKHGDKSLWLRKLKYEN